MPAATEYASRLLAYTAGKDPLAMQAEMPGILAELIRGVPRAKLAASPAPGKWSVSEILAHLAEDELTSSWRYRQMLEHEGIALAGFDQDLWAKLGNYPAWNPEESLEMFRLLREANLRMLRTLSPEQWQRYGMHAERGKITVRDWRGTWPGTTETISTRYSGCSDDPAHELGTEPAPPCLRCRLR